MGKDFLLTRILNILFPPKCVFCGRLLSGKEKNICGNCLIYLPWAEKNKGKEVDYLTRCIFPLWYRDEVVPSFHRYKFGGREEYALIYGSLMAQCVKKQLDKDWDVITWAPLSDKRRKERGYDQAMLLAQVMAMELGEEPIQLLHKIKNIQAQSGISNYDQRRANVQGAYEICDPKLVDGRRIILVDDVVTTGSTLAQCGKMLLLAGAKEVMGVTFARAGERNTS